MAALENYERATEREETYFVEYDCGDLVTEIIQVGHLTSEFNIGDRSDVQRCGDVKEVVNCTADESNLAEQHLPDPEHATSERIEQRKNFSPSVMSSGDKCRNSDQSDSLKFPPAKVGEIVAANGSQNVPVANPAKEPSSDVVGSSAKTPSKLVAKRLFFKKFTLPNNSRAGRARKARVEIPAWRTGPAKLWFDMLNVPMNGAGFSYGFKLRDNSKQQTGPPKIEYPLDAYLLISQVNWEKDVIWNTDNVRADVTGKLSFSPNSNSNNNENRATTFSRLPSGTETVAGRTAALSSRERICHCCRKANSEPVQFSSLPVENEELVVGRWQEEIIWDPYQMDRIPEPSMLTLDPNDHQLVLEIPTEVDRLNWSRRRYGRAKRSMIRATEKMSVDDNGNVNPYVTKLKRLKAAPSAVYALADNNRPSSLDSDDEPFNISNDRYYAPADTVGGGRINLNFGTRNFLQHSTPVVKLRAPFVPTHIDERTLRNFHRPTVKRFGDRDLDKHYVRSLTDRIRSKAEEREKERIASGGGYIFFMRTGEDLTGRDGDLVLIEFSEEYPPLMSLVGMCSKIKNYYKRKSCSDNGPSVKYRYGETAYVHTSPFLGSLTAGKTVQALENNLYRAPLYEHAVPGTDFLVVRTADNRYYIRQIDGLYVAGQQCPLYEVPSPNSKWTNNFVAQLLRVFVYRLFWRSRAVPRQIGMNSLKELFPAFTENTIRNRLKLYADFKRTARTVAQNANYWIMKPGVRLPPEEEIVEMVTPEQCCAYFSMLESQQRLTDAGYGNNRYFLSDEEEDDFKSKLDDEVKCASWNTSRAYIQAMNGKSLLQLTGPADPTGCGEGFSYVRVSNKPIAKKTTSVLKEKRPKVTGTDADLRKLSLKDARALLLHKFGLPEDKIKRLSRWEVINVVRTLSTKKSKEDSGDKGVKKFSRGNPYSMAESRERYRAECQRIFDLQNKVLSSSEVLSTDEDRSSEDEDNCWSDIEEVGKSIERMLDNKLTSADLKALKEERERKKLSKYFVERKTSNSDVANTNDGSSSGTSFRCGGRRILTICRTYLDADGRQYTRSEEIHDQDVIDYYVKIRTTKSEDFLRQFAMSQVDSVEEQPKRIKKISSSDNTKKRKYSEI